MDDIKQALNNFDDKVFSIMSEQHEITYENFATSYRDTFATIWHKAGDASVKMILISVTDKQLQELKCMACLLNNSCQLS